jgi:hypothetical protein
MDSRLSAMDASGTDSAHLAAHMLMARIADR